VLEADDLRTLLEALRPPAGYQLDRAVGTTFSLDLYALVAAPLAFALFDTEDSEDGHTSVAGLLEALRRYSDRIDIFCQAGQIALPAKYRPIISYLESAVHEVAPRDRRRIFHPKVWTLRYASEGKSPLYRLLVLSRNLTFDRSWDTLLVLNGERSRDSEVRELSAPLVKFLRALPGLAVGRIPRERREHVTELARDFATIRFALPPGFDELRFWPLGLSGTKRTPFANLVSESGRRLIVAPFLTSALLGRLGSGGILVSRAESLDAIPTSQLEVFTACHVLSEAATGSDPAEDDEIPVPAETVAEAAGTTLRGLHAKLFVFETGWDAHVFTGSANATSAAFGGNVEFVAELVGKRSRCGVDAILDGRGGTGFGTLLEPYDPTASPPKGAETDLALRLDELRRLIACQPLAASVEPMADAEGYRVTLRSSGEDVLPPSSAARCWPITLDRSAALPLSRVWDDGAVFVLSPEGVTAFFAVELRLRDGRTTERVDFVVRAELDGAPKDRLDRLLVQLLRTRGDVLRYMLFLLAGDDDALATLRGLTSAPRPDHDLDDGRVLALDVPLVEWMVRALARTPDRIEHLSRLVESLRATDEGRELLPPDFDAVWDVIWAARTGRRA
jgi:hypothetical protein